MGFPQRKQQPQPERSTAPEELSGPELQRWQWRCHVLMQVGYDASDAMALVSAGTDVYLVQRLVGKGCPLNLASRIAASLEVAA